MKYLITILAVLIIAGCSKPTATADYNVVPLPAKIELKNGYPFTIKSSTKISYPVGNEKLMKTAMFLSEYIKTATGMQLQVTDKELTKNAIILKNNFANANSEAYQLSVDGALVTINGSSDAGAFYGVQTLRKAIGASAEGMNVVLPNADIVDSPRFSYRGMHLDVSRHFFPVEFVKKYIDLLALHNLNRFHWHLSDDQGWRVEIKKYPELTEKGSVRNETLIGSLYVKPHKYDGKPYGGYYTQDQIRDVVKYADERFVTIIPEIDLPGHMLGALKAYPELGCTGGPYETATTWGVFKDVLCVGNEKTFEFLDGVFSEIIELFPSKYIHIGGDECPKDMWKVCPKCQAKAKELGLKKDGKHSVEDQLQSYCMSRVEKFLNDKGREIIGWDEILEGGVAPNATVMSWRGTEGGIAAAKLGHDAIMVPHYNLYFDYYQSENRENEPLAIGGFNPVEKVYGYEPVPEELTEQEKKHIIGAQANIWTEYMHTPSHVEYMLLPRLAALSEVQWMAAERKNYQDFLKRLVRLYPFYEVMECNPARHVLDSTAVKASDEMK